MAYGMGNELQMLESAAEAAGIAWWVMELPSGAIFFSPNKVKMLGYDDPDKFIHYKHFTDLVHPDDYEPMMQNMRDHMEGKTDTYETRYRIKCKDGKYKTFYDRGKIVVRKPNSDMTVTGMVLDVSSYAVDATKKAA
jgi:PAS domain S-box-containing protein